MGFTPGDFFACLVCEKDSGHSCRNLNRQTLMPGKNKQKDCCFTEDHVTPGARKANRSRASRWERVCTRYSEEGDGDAYQFLHSLRVPILGEEIRSMAYLPESSGVLF